MEIDWLKQWNTYSPEKVALIDADENEQLTYSQLYFGSIKGAHHLKNDLEIKLQEPVAVLAKNSALYVQIYFAINRLGAILVPLNHRLAPAELHYILKNAGARVLIYDSEFASEAEALKKELNLKILNFAEIKNICWESQHANLPAATQASLAEAYSMREFSDDLISMILYTSGTTGHPKGAMISYRALFWNSINTGLRLNLTEDDVFVSFLPLFHTGGWNVLLTPFLHRGAQVILIKKFDAQRVLALSSYYKATLLFGVPTTMALMAEQEIFSSVNLKPIRYAIVGGEPMPINLIDRWHGKGIAIRQGYGLTEFGPNVFSLHQKDAIRKRGSVGHANFYVDVKILTDDGHEILEPEQIGELALRGPMCMTGYWNNPEASAKSIQNGWLLTGDLAKRDSEGFYYIVGRKKEMFISGGENIYPIEIEKVIYQLAEVQEVAVIGVPDAKWGEVGRAYISLKPQAILTEEKVFAHLENCLARFKIPKSIVWLNELPKGDSGKILKRELANQNR